MSVTVTPADIFLRLLAALLAGGLIGFDRGVRGRIAGLRTTILICLAAAGAMIEANLLLSVTGKTADSFVNIDVLRFPLGILSGIGFIGAGAIVRRGQLVTGVTTAATLWLVTVIGLILGAGYFGLGLGLTLLALVVLNILKRVEPRLTREHRTMLHLTLSPEAPDNESVRARILEAGYRISSFDITYGGGDGATRLILLGLRWAGACAQDRPPPLAEQLAREKGVLALRWQPVEAGHQSE